MWHPNEQPNPHFYSKQAVVNIFTTQPLIYIGITPLNNNNTYGYDGKAHAFAFTVNPSNVGTDSFGITYYKQGDWTETLTGAPSAVGVYDVFVSREADTTNNYAAYNGTFTLTITAGTQTAPSAPTVAGQTTNSITLTAIADSSLGTKAQYGYLTGGGTDTSAITWQDSPVFENLQPGTSYTFYARYNASTDGGAMLHPRPAQERQLLRCLLRRRMAP